MKIKEITAHLEFLAPLSSQASYDNCGLLVGNQEEEVNAALICLDCTELVVEEAIAKECNLIIAHHPIIFSGLKKINGKNEIERTIIKAIENKIAIYAIHTNLDNYRYGVNFEIGKRLGLRQLKVLQPTTNQLTKLAFFVPTDYSEAVSQAVFEAGAGEIGNYRDCSFEQTGFGTYTPNTSSDPFSGTKETKNKLTEKKIEVIVSNHQLPSVIAALITAHPYEEVAYDCFPLRNENQYEGSGMIGLLPEAMDEWSFLTFLKSTFHCGIIRHTTLLNKKIKTVAFCGGSGSFLLPQAKKKKADIFITGDFKYHEFFSSDNQIVIADIGHFESEQFTTNLIADILKEKFPTFATHLTGIITNPINYF
jgi:dinuclear metal center YbgI/SA1388 family protein